MAVSGIISEPKRDIGRKSLFFIFPAFETPVRGSRRNVATTVVRKS